MRYDDVTPDGLLIRKTKFQKTRLVPLHETAVARLGQYQAQRRTLRVATDHVFIDDHGRPLEYRTAYRVFGRLAESAGMALLRGHRPRPHELRHTFALRALQSTPAGRNASDSTCWHWPPISTTSALTRPTGTPVPKQNTSTKLPLPLYPHLGPRIHLYRWPQHPLGSHRRLRPPFPVERGFHDPNSSRRRVCHSPNQSGNSSTAMGRPMK